MLTKSEVSPRFNLELSEPSHTFDREDTDAGRYYNTPFGRFASVTTKLGWYYDIDLSKWIERVGEAEARKITRQGAQRGTAIHKICENYILGNEYKAGVMPIYLETFNKIKPILDENIGTVWGIEYPLYSEYLKTAGTTDLICEYKGQPTIVDFKTSRYPKKEEWIESYLTQATTYAHMSNSILKHLNYGIEHVCIIIGVDGDQPQIFHKPITDQMWRHMEEVMLFTEKNEANDKGNSHKTDSTGDSRGVQLLR